MRIPGLELHPLPPAEPHKPRPRREFTPTELELTLVHIPKTGGTSVCRTLGVSRDHKPITDKPDRGYKAAFIRNPWDRALSWWRYSNLCRKMKFHEWVMSGMDPRWTCPSTTRRVQFHDQLSWITIDGEVAVQFLGRFETLHEDFDRLCDVLEYPRQKLLHINDKSGRVDDYRHHWSAEMVERAAPILNPVADRLGYKFGDEPLRVKA